MDDHFCPDTIPVPTLDIKDRRIYKCLVVHKRHRPPEVLAGRHITDVCKIRIGAAQRDPQVRHVSACDAMGRRDVEVAINDVFRNNHVILWLGLLRLLVSAPPNVGGDIILLLEAGHLLAIDNQAMTLVSAVVCHGDGAYAELESLLLGHGTEFVNKFLIALNTCRFALGKLIMGPLQKSLSSTSISNFERKTADATMFTCKVSGGAGAVL